MFILYNLTQFLILPVIFIPAVVYILFREKYRNRILYRLGFNLASRFPTKNTQGPTFWIHALSVGEVTSAMPLLLGIERQWPLATIVVSVTTQAGRNVATSLLHNTRVTLIDGPLDFLPTISHFIRTIRPDYFIMVETDFWPNLLNCLNKKGIRTILVNGRISRNSTRRYLKFRPFFYRMFNLFDHLCLQTETDKSNFRRIGISQEKLHTLGNLKYDTIRCGKEKGNTEMKALLPGDGPIFIAGSTHRGEEATIIRCFCRLRHHFPQLQLILAPRHPERTPEILALAEKNGLEVALRSNERLQFGDIFLLDTLGELNTFYDLADIAFVGGSLVAAGGHNPLEPAKLGIPVLFGPHMEDFEEISALLLQRGGAIEIFDEDSLFTQLEKLLTNQDYRRNVGKAAENTVAERKGVVAAHVDLLQGL